MDRPKLIETKYGQHIYDGIEFNNFFNSIVYNTSDISGKCLYIESKTISQNKIRERGFTITRERYKADVIITSDYFNSKYNYCYGAKGNIAILESSHIEDFFSNFDSSYSYVLDKELYKYLYKYDGNQELFYSCQELLQSNSSDNVRMAMEFISNANWIGNEIYLKELFNNNWSFSSMRGNTYKTSVSFKGFINSLDFRHDNVSMYDASDYIDLCKNEEHHNWVYNKYEKKFKEELDDLFVKHKMKIDKIEYSIDKSLFHENTV